VNHLKEEKISSYQVVMLVAGGFLGSYIISNPVSESGSDIWFAVLVAVAEALLLAFITGAISMLHPGKSLVGILTALQQYYELP
jgi:hypothetical protein